ncbi:hypothetical protein SAMN04488032_11657 [Pacificibacter marinus]|uniref:Helix-turn-helix domain protein n=1 Tax=Pacificibacter marinus TaxID=658057 RepID=A0A1Y5TP55_9RHOB|nr:hypothetical protein SAMN04488032_11657 [Pacificibacter marinus]SLN66677.1 hypothetical protein PAM7971_03512 [Pacificibacter marinus]
MGEVLPIFVRVSKSQEVFGLHPSTIYRKAERAEITMHKRGSASFLRVSDMIKHIEGENSA